MKLEHCQICDTRVKSKGNKFCGVTCYRKHQRSGNYKSGVERKHEYSCHTCNELVHRRPSQKRNGDVSDKVFCSRACYQKHHETKYKFMTCLGCSKESKIPTSNKSKYCSIGCRRKIRVSECNQCSVEFSALSYRRKKDGGFRYARVVKKMCSDECKSNFYKTDVSRKESISKAFTGDKHPNWKGGSSKKSYRGSNWALVREGVFDVKGCDCVICGISRNNHRIKYNMDLHIDHIVPWHQFDDENEANNIDNLRPLCVSCHSKSGESVRLGPYRDKNKSKLERHEVASKITLQQCKEIKAKYKTNGVSWSNVKDISNEYGLSYCTVRNIYKGNHWSNAYI